MSSAFAQFVERIWLDLGLASAEYMRDWIAQAGGYPIA